MTSSARQRGRGILVPVVLLVLAATGCDAPPATPGPSLGTTPGPVRSDPVEPTGPAESELGPTAATITGVDGAVVEGMLGTVVWDGIVSDAPWLPGHPVSVLPGTAVTVHLTDFSVPLESWTTRVAPAGRHGFGIVFSDEGGGGEPIGALVPDRGGPWELSLSVRYRGGNEANWFWTLDVD